MQALERKVVGQPRAVSAAVRAATITLASHFEGAAHQGPFLFVGPTGTGKKHAAFAEKSFFRKRIVHVAFLAGLISKILGMDFPGQGTVYILQNSVFKRPVYVDTTVKVEVKVTEVIAEKRRLVLDTNVLNEKGEICLAGSATVWIPE